MYFLNYKPYIGLVLNIDYDHVDYFKNEEAYIQAFYKFSKQAKKKVIVNGDGYNLSKIDNTYNSDKESLYENQA